MRHGTHDTKSHLIPLWQQQCDAAVTINRNFGLAKALEYLVAGKFLPFIRRAEDDRETTVDLVLFAQAVRGCFSKEDLVTYLAELGTPRGLRALSVHRMSRDETRHLVRRVGQLLLPAAGRPR